jgi:hypothetical protein
LPLDKDGAVDGTRTEDAIHRTSSVTYFRLLEETVKSNIKCVAKLFSDIRRFAQTTQTSFQEVASKLEWSSKMLNMTDLVRQLEFTLIRLETRSGEL